MYAKINDGTVTQFPYTFGDLRRNYPNVSFPKVITATIMQKYGMVGVVEGPKPSTTAYQTVQRNALPTRPVTGKNAEGKDIIANYWMINYTAVDMFADVKGKDSDGKEVVVQTKAEAEAEYQKTLDNNAATTNRAKRDGLLTETDWVVTKAAETGGTVSTAWKTYRQALRDISSHSNWPHLEEANWPEKP